MQTFTDFVKEDIVEAVDPKIKALNAKWARFQTGDHVHQTVSSRFDYPSHYGVVEKHDGNAAHVKWEDGTKTIHSQSSAMERKRPEHHYDWQRKSIDHNETFDSTTRRATRVTNDEHKAHVAKIKDAKQAERQHAETVQTARIRLENMHHSALKPHHVAAIHAILDKAVKGED